MQFERLSIPDIIQITPKRFGDARGFFAETYRTDVFEAEGIGGPFVQDNFVYSAEAGVLRGLHFQRPPTAQAKLIRCTRGAIFDVAVDIRRGSPTYGAHVSAELSAENGALLYVPVGFAHGYMTLTPDCDVHYKVSAYYSPDDEGGVAWDDPDLGIMWPTEGLTLQLSEKDKCLPRLADFETVF